MSQTTQATEIIKTLYGWVGRDLYGSPVLMAAAQVLCCKDGRALGQIAPTLNQPRWEETRLPKATLEAIHARTVAALGPCPWPAGKSSTPAQRQALADIGERIRQMPPLSREQMLSIWPELEGRLP